jgi:hypothetical protein
MKRQKTKRVKKGGGFGSDAYDATATVGRISSWFSLFFGCIFGIIFSAAGVYLSTIVDEYDKTTNATIKTVKCTGTGKEQSCSLNVEYSVDGKNMTSDIIKSGAFNEGQTIAIKYSSKNPSNITADTLSAKFLGIGLIFLGVLILIGSCVSFYLVQNNKLIAAASGTGNIAGLVFNND